MPARARIVSRRAGPGARRKEAPGQPTGNPDRTFDSLGMSAHRQPPSDRPSASSALGSHMSREAGGSCHRVRRSRMRFSIRSRAVAWSTGWILPLCRPATTSSRRSRRSSMSSRGLGLVENPVVFDGSGHDLRVSPGHHLGRSRSPVRPSCREMSTRFVLVCVVRSFPWRNLAIV